jgi:hypothetical protein
MTKIDFRGDAFGSALKGSRKRNKNIFCVNLFGNKTLLIQEYQPWCSSMYHDKERKSLRTPEFWHGYPLLHREFLIFCGLTP